MKRLRVRIELGWGWQVISTIAAVCGIIALLLFNRLFSLLPGYSQTEVLSAAASKDLATIFDNPINAPYKLVSFGYAQVTSDPLLATRLAAATFGVATLILFYVGMRNWYRRRVAFLATILFACSGWFLHTARLGSADILFPCSILLLTVCGYWIATASRSKLSYIAAVVALGLCAYVPGLIWLLALALVVRRKDLILLSLRLSMWYRVGLAAALLLFVIIPLALAIIRNPHTGLELLGLPSQVPNIIDVLKNIAQVPLDMFIRSQGNPEMHLGRLPLLDVFTGLMCLLGIYYYFVHRTLDRAKLLLVVFIIGTLLIALGGPVHISLLLPAIYVIVTGGIALLLNQWLDVFPRNPVARTTGIILITAAVLLSCLFNLRAYFIAWPNNDATEAAFSKTSEDLLK